MIIAERQVANYVELHLPQRNAIVTPIPQQNFTKQNADTTVADLNIKTISEAKAERTVLYCYINLYLLHLGDVEELQEGIQAWYPKSIKVLVPQGGIYGGSRILVKPASLSCENRISTAAAQKLVQQNKY